MPVRSPGKRYLDSEVADPNDQPIDNVRDIRDDLRARIIELLFDLNIRQQGAAHGRQTVRSIRLCP
jgi:hypothetical protein